VIAQLANLENPQIVDLKKSSRGNPATYEIWGQIYKVLPSAEGYLEEGNASWYGTKFHGRSTSSGQPFDMYALTAAHRSLPIPVFAKVTNLSNGLSTVVLINDRGPFHRDRILDLSFAAAVKLGFHQQGTARVRVEAISNAQPKFLADVGEFTNVERARSAQGQLAETSGVTVDVVKTKDRNSYHLRIGPISSGPSLERVKALAATLGLGRLFVRAIR
jgi:rare lipoprotein A